MTQQAPATAEFDGWTHAQRQRWLAFYNLSAVIPPSSSFPLLPKIRGARNFDELGRLTLLKHPESHHIRRYEYPVSRIGGRSVSMPDRPQMQKHHSSSSVSVHSLARSPGAGVRHVVGGGSRARLGARVPSYARNVNKLTKLTPAHAGQKAVLPRNASKTTLRKNKSETALHRRNNSSNSIETTSEAESPMENDSTTHTSKQTTTSPRPSSFDSQTDSRLLNRATSNLPPSSAFRPTANTTTTAAPFNKATAQDESSQTVRAPRSRDNMSSWEDNVAESFDFEAEASMIELASREKKKQQSAKPDENILPLRPYAGLSHVDRARKDAQEAGDEADTAEKISRDNIRRGKQPILHPSDDRRVKFTIGDDKINIDTSPSEPATGLTTPQTGSSVELPHRPHPSIVVSSNDQKAAVPKPRGPSETPKSSPPVSTPSGQFSIQSNLDRDRAKTMQPVYDLPPSAWRSHRLIEVTPHLTDPKSEYTAKFLNRVDREIDKKLENMAAIRDVLKDSNDRIRRGTYLGEEADDASAGATLAADHVDGEDKRKKPEASSASLAAWFGGLATAAAGSRTESEGGDVDDDEVEEEDEGEWLERMEEMLDELEEYDPAFAEQFRGLLRARRGDAGEGSEGEDEEDEEEDDDDVE